MATLPPSEVPGGYSLPVLTGSTRIRRVFGWRPQMQDARDKIFKLPPRIPPIIPTKVDLTSLLPPVIDQGRIGSCVANAIAIAIQFLRRKEGIKPDMLSSRLFNYYNTRVMERSVQFDAGAIIRDSIKVAATLGAPREFSWQYRDTPADPVTNQWRSTDKPRRKPTAVAFALGLDKQTISYEVIPRDLPTIRACLASGFPFVFGFSVYTSFLSDGVARTGNVPMPSNSASDIMVGGHAVLAVGYDDERKVIICRNSWSKDWGDNGNFYLPYDYIIGQNLADDFWTIRASE